MDNFWIFNAVGVAIFAVSIYGFSIIIEWLVIKRVVNDPANGLMTSICCSYVLSVIYAYTVPKFDFTIFIDMTLGLFLALLVCVPTYRKIRKRQFEQLAAEE